MQLDHIFIFSKEHDYLSQVLNEFGIIEGICNIHKGQGTACRRFFFHNGYLELVWVINELEVKNSAMARAKLWERSEYHQTGYCPYGICLRSDQRFNGTGTLIFPDGWRYYTSYLPAGQFANIAANENYTGEPVLFEMPFFGLAPKDYPEESQQPLLHERGFQEITKISLELPDFSSGLSDFMKRVLHNGIIEVAEGVEYFVTIEFDFGKSGEKHEFLPLAPLAFSW